MLLNGTPPNTWTSVGNGTYNGIYHELHFMHNENVVGHRVYQGISSNSSRLTNRASGYDLGPVKLSELGIGAEAYFDPDSDTGLTTSFDKVDLTPVQGAEFVGDAIEATISESEFNELCCQSSVLGQTVSTAVIRVTVGVSPGALPWNSPYTPEQALEICRNGTIGSVTFSCPYNLTSIDPELLDDPDRNETEYVWLALSTRTDHSGPAVDYIIVNYANSAQRTTFTSATYPNGLFGQSLRASGGDPHAYALANRDCTNTTLINMAPIGRGGVPVHSEHIIERVTIRNFMEFVQNPRIDLEDGQGEQTVPLDLGTVPFAVINDYMNLPYNQWPGLAGQQLNNNSLFGNLGNALGSTAVPRVMPNLQASLNNVKTRVWGAIVNTNANPTFNRYANNPTTRNTESALSLLRSASF
ncbi:uncharacterized protein EAE97_000153 [Botrytis byssoidea]|uniref:Uncharacterized protein n=1 Tax=Botrytis byssoidea TaxID=139641 RepID=A0A9P5IXR6_9HELO|nr:uncharacterized protein EAE97_000153 [Botrytis byssoidea]KAF7954894.1 hypothetical protein EAE97_000153 [Botrytis byssoidea]